jgi:hypothetical protein
LNKYAEGLGKKQSVFIPELYLGIFEEKLMKSTGNHNSW